ncbi:hypothetical protein QBC40DRAFT_302436 [Triangularia verruculosa]|uniref:Uncharacterized protein n=1 Tax=Triangularia verruculosa TaxID=2587418 RepID=A0AAN6X4U1_9PEZI|nr:hypothetical protein QBC40DRAFT_302436 [Triangularia verruculosa]
MNNGLVPALPPTKEVEYSRYSLYILWLHVLYAPTMEDYLKARELLTFGQRTTLLVESANWMLKGFLVTRKSTVNDIIERIPCLYKIKERLEAGGRFTTLNNNPCHHAYDYTIITIEAATSLWNRFTLNSKVLSAIFTYDNSAQKKYREIMKAMESMRQEDDMDWEEENGRKSRVDYDGIQRRHLSKEADFWASSAESVARWNRWFGG